MFEEKNPAGGKLTKLLLALSISSVLATGAWAQDSDEDDEDSADLGRIEVTGSLIKREDFTSTSPVQIINAETQAQVGQLTVADILQGTSVANSTLQVNNQFNGFIVQGGTGVQTLDLRGVGAQRTLVLLNGRRPGASGTRGQTFALDLATIPDVALQRAEFVLDGSSSIYGSDAVAGVANLITRRSVDTSEFQALTELTEEGGGNLYRGAFITGLNFAKGAVTLSGQFQVREELKWNDRDFLGCTRDLFRDAAGNIIDREDRSITAGTPLEGCPGNLYANTIIDFGTGARYIPSPDGVTIGPFPGYRPRANGRYDDANGEAFYEDVLNFDFFGEEYALNRSERITLYGTADYSFDFWGGVDWDLDVLYSNRQTEERGWRQFFPTVSTARFVPYPDDPTYDPAPDGGFLFGLPVMPYPSNGDIEIDYFYVTTGLEGLLPTDNFWTWQVYATYSYSDGDYTGNSILASRSGDINFDTSPPRVDYFDPGFLSGERMMELVDAVGVNQTGNTVYDQWQTTAIVSGDLFSMPAGVVGAAFGLEYRRFSIDDVPSEPSRNGDLWGESSALVTKGTNDVWEAFAEFEVPLLAGLPAVEELTVNGSVRYFDYKEGGDDTVWKAGLRWQIVPSVMFRATAGTSYRAPGLFELYLGNETSFVGQNAIDPCVDWGESNNPNIRRNCEAAGVPSDYQGGGSSAQITSGGGAGNLDPETSDAYTFGLVWTPEFTDLSIAVDYVDIEINNQIDSLGASAIVSGCYNSENFPNTFCDLFFRQPADAPERPNQIIDVTDTFININEQRYKGIDLNLVWNLDFDFGQVELAAQSTWNLERVQKLFDPDEVEGFDETDFVGTVSNPENVTNFRASLRRDDWRYNYFLQYVGETDDTFFADPETTYFGFDPAFADVTMDAVFYHNVSVIYTRDKWDLLVGINNLLDEEPDTLSDFTRALAGNVPRFASQYDWFGRRYFVRFNWRL